MSQTACGEYVVQRGDNRSADSTNVRDLDLKRSHTGASVPRPLQTVSWTKAYDP